MCKARNSKWIKLGKKRVRVDSCIANLIVALNEKGFKTLASCCGHGVYPVTIIYQVTRASDVLYGNIYDFCSGWGMRGRNTRFYIKNKRNKLYYIPEVSGKSGEITLPSATSAEGVK